MNKGEKYIEAAKEMSENQYEFCCHLIRRRGLSTKQFKKYFDPNNGSIAFYGDIENQLARSLALLFMAELDK